VIFADNLICARYSKLCFGLALGAFHNYISFYGCLKFALIINIMKKDDRNIGERFGNLIYHHTVLSRKCKEVTNKVQEIRGTDIESMRKKNNILLGFKKEAEARIDKIEYQIEGLKKHLSPDAMKFAEEIAEKNIKVFKDGFEEHKIEFSTADN
jgi:hypothetical protein